MGKISPVSSKYIVHTRITIDGVVDRPDIIGAIFGQTEGLLGADLELRELQRSGRIGRIEVNVNTTTGKTVGEITIPSSLDKAETAIVAAALEIIQRIGPCTATIKVNKIEDVRVAKRTFVIERAKELLRILTDETLPDSTEIADEVAQSVRVMEITEYGKDRLAAGPAIDDSDEIIIVEGRADVVTLLKYGFKNAIAINGTSIPDTVKDLCQQKVVTVFVDGDRGGDLIIKELMTIGEIDFVAKAPDGKEVEELAKKEIHKALRSRITAEQAKHDIGERTKAMERKPFGARRDNFPPRQQGFVPPSQPSTSTPTSFATRPAPHPTTGTVGSPAPMMRREDRPSPQPTMNTSGGLGQKEKAAFREVLDDLVGTRAAVILDQKLKVLGKVPVTELSSTVKSVGSSIHAIVLDGVITEDLVKAAEDAKVNYVVASESKVPKHQTGAVNVVTDGELNA